jgi:cell wall-associated NlpC family hydrolase
MTPYFSRPEAVAVLRAELPRWLGTPFRQAARLPGPQGGVDCVGLVIAAYEAAGAIEPGEHVPPPYELEHYEHTDTSQLEEWFRRPEIRARVRRCDEDDPRMDGDLLFLRHRRTTHHTGLWLDGMVWHVIRGHGVVQMHPRTLALPHLSIEIRSAWRIHERTAPAGLCPLSSVL